MSACGTVNRSSVAIAAMLALIGGCAPLPASRALPSAQSAGSARLVPPAKSNETVLYSFNGYTDGGDPAADLIADSSGTLYGTTVVGGEYSCGTVFRLAPSKTPPWNETALYSFDCYSTGKNPYGGITFDAHGNLDGTTVSGGGSCNGYGCGLVFQLDGSSEAVLHDFDGADGSGPGGGVAIDKSGSLYGTTPDGGADSAGVVYRVSAGRSGWRETVIHTFTGGTDGSVGSLGRLLVDTSGNVYGVAEEGGAGGDGTVYELSHPKGKWQFTTLYAFQGTPDAASPYGGLVADASGDLFGTTYYGGSAGAGTVFELVRSSKRHYRERVLYSFKGGSDGSNPTSTLVFGASGELYGTTSNGGGSCGTYGYGCGVVFAFNPKNKKERVLHSFGGTNDGSHPYYGLLLGKHGVLYGTTAAGGGSGQGVIFEVKP
jgi:uncharacterized repeat protein (TIGR03803 family)